MLHALQSYSSWSCSPAELHYASDCGAKVIASVDIDKLHTTISACKLTYTPRIYGKLFADRGYISPSLFEALFADGVHLVTGIRSNMKNKLMPLWDKIMLRKRYITNVLIICLRTRAIWYTQDTDPSTISWWTSLLQSVHIASLTTNQRQSKGIVLRKLNN